MENFCVELCSINLYFHFISFHLQSHCKAQKDDEGWKLFFFSVPEFYNVANHFLVKDLEHELIIVFSLEIPYLHGHLNY